MLTGNYGGECVHTNKTHTRTALEPHQNRTRNTPEPHQKHTRTAPETHQNRTREEHNKYTRNRSRHTEHTQDEHTKQSKSMTQGPISWQTKFFLNTKGKREETKPMVVQVLLLEGEHAISPWNRNVFHKEFSDKNKSDRLYKMMVFQQSQTMIRKEVVYPDDYEKVEGDAKYDLFDGCHRYALLCDFFAGRCYVEIQNPDENNLPYRAYVSQKAIDAADHTTFPKKQMIVLSENGKSNIKECPVTMIQLDVNMSNADAYDRSRIANECTKLSSAQLFKHLACRDTKLAKFYGAISTETQDSDFNQLMGDSIFKYNAAILFHIDLHGFAGDFSKNLAVITKPESLERILLAEEQQRPEGQIDALHAHIDELRYVIVTAKSKINVLIAERKENKCQEDAYAMGLQYIALSMAIANERYEKGNYENLSTEAISGMATRFSQLKQGEKGNNQERLYLFYKTGIWNDLHQPKKRARQNEFDTVGECVEL